jgi:hypothetical protein
MQWPPEPTVPEPQKPYERLTAAHHEPAAWRPKEWIRKVPIGRSKLYLEVRAGRIKTVKVGSATLITTSPGDYLASLRDERAA